jgi:hypothetical protein
MARKKLESAKAPGEQRIEKFPQTGRDTSKRHKPPGVSGAPANTQKMISGMDPRSPDKSKRFNPPPV